MAICKASTKEEYYEIWATLQPCIPPQITRYLEDTWLDRHKEQFVAAWTKDVINFGHAVTSRVEGSHAYLKHWLGVSTLYMDEVYEKVVLAGNAQQREISRKISAERMQLPIRLKASFWGNVVRMISSYALYKVHDLYQLALKPSGPIKCSGVFTSTMGIPCEHTLRIILAKSKSLEVTEFSRHWWLHQPRLSSSSKEERSFAEIMASLTMRYDDMGAYQQAMLRLALENLDSPHAFVMRNPVVARTRGRPSGSHNSSTKRDPSLFEHVEANILKKRRCGVCKAEGHNKQTCPRIAVDAAVLDTRTNENRIVSVSDDAL
ncbi:hypothetical protein PsorP6_000404 [Peronosclerospora sorghi]|uniref:Uncharacterized protein n=1 Tax=Peronosclerospora sorghi TaxID=230839 RepID=A0ACC0WVJ9_9STRA|nr:hypothetical protein PsorP6_000404 [Peronosclerospora sorghi]